jgi:hypothetical protein
MSDRRSVLFALAGLTALGGPASAQPGGFVREGSQGWVRRQSGSVAARAGASRIKVVTQGRLVVQSSPKARQVEYVWVQRVPLNLGEEALDAIATSAKIKAQEQGEWCVVATSLPGDETFSELTVTVPESFSVARLETRAGGLRLSRLSGDIQAATGAGNVDIDAISGEIVLRTGGGTVNAGAVKGNLRCLSNGGTIRVQEVSGDSILETAGGEIFLNRSGGAARLSTAGGNIMVGRAARNVFAHTAAGSIEVNESGGIVTAETGSGGIQVSRARGARCESGSGIIRLVEVTGGVRASTVSGSVFVTFAPGSAIEQSYLATSRGDITVHLPSTLAVTVKAMNESAGWVGRMISEFDEIRPQPMPVWGKGPLLAEGSLNGGGPLLMMTTSNGIISLKRRK